MAAALAPLALAAGMSFAPHVGNVLGRGVSKLANLIGFEKGGSTNPKSMRKALQQATVKRTGVRKVKKNELVIPAGLAKQIKKVAKRKPTVVKHHKKHPKKKGRR